MSDEVKRAWNDAIEAVANEYDADVNLFSGAIDDTGFGMLTKAVAEGKTRGNALLILVTNGGLANAGYQIARLFQSQYEKFTVFCPSRCKSAGTLVALGATELLMDNFSELGPLDVQLVKQNEIFARKSGLLSRSALEALAGSAFELYEQLMIGITVKSNGNVGFKLASELSAEMTSAMMSPIYGQINAETIGSEHRDLNVAYEYGIRLIECSNNSSIESVYHLVHNYPSHDFIIDVREAAGLFTNVNEPSENLYVLTGFFMDKAQDEASPSFVHALKPVTLDGEEDDDAVGTADVPREDSSSALDEGRSRDRQFDSEAPGEGGSRGEGGPRKDGIGETDGQQSTRISSVGANSD